MRVLTEDEARSGMEAVLTSDEPVFFTRAGQVSGSYRPVTDPVSWPEDVRRTLLTTLGAYLSNQLEAEDVSEEAVLEDFRAHRRARR